MLMLVLVPLVQGLDQICEDIITPGENCTMLTPSISCTNYTYNIYNRTRNTIYKDYNLSQLNGSIYYFSFNLSEGSYIIELCDNSTREIIVKSEDEMIYFSIILVFMFFIILTVWGLIRSEKMWIKTVLTLGLSILIMSVTRFLSWFVSINHPGETELINTLDHFYMFGVWGFRFVMIGACFILLIMILNALKNSGKNKKDNWDDWGAE